jgi:DNA polymerase III subunit delta'
MQAQTHPDWYRLEAEKGKSTLGIDAVRQVTEKLYHFAQQGGAKVVWLPDAAQLSESAANALLKTLEEPPANSWFFLSSREPSRLLATLRSRCMALSLTPPDEAQSLQWLSRQMSQDEAALQAALRLSAGAPAAALQLLEPARWQARQTLCNALPDALRQDILQLLPALNSEDVAARISWLLALLVDALKWQQGATRWLSNPDRQDVVALLADTFSSRALDESAREWMQCREQLIHVAAVNRELLLTDRLLSWADRRKPGVVA